MFFSVQPIPFYVPFKHNGYIYIAAHWIHIVSFLKQLHRVKNLGWVGQQHFLYHLIRPRVCLTKLIWHQVAVMVNYSVWMLNEGSFRQTTNCREVRWQFLCSVPPSGQHRVWLEWVKTAYFLISWTMCQSHDVGSKDLFLQIVQFKWKMVNEICQLVCSWFRFTINVSDFKLGSFCEIKAF